MRVLSRFDLGSPSVMMMPAVDSSSTLAAMRPTNMSVGLTSSNCACLIARPPTLQGPTRPLSLAPASRSTGCPSALSPIRREKYGRPLSMSGCEIVLVPVRPKPRRPPTRAKRKMSESLRKNVRFSGKNRLKRVSSTWRSSTSVAEKSVFRVRAPLSEGVSL